MLFAIIKTISEITVALFAVYGFYSLIYDTFIHKKKRYRWKRYLKQKKKTSFLQ